MINIVKHILDYFQNLSMCRFLFANIFEYAPFLYSQIVCKIELCKLQCLLVR